MTTRDRLFLAVLLIDCVVLAIVELLYLPLAFDGYLLPYLAGGLPLPLMPLLAAVTMPLLVSSAARLSSRMIVIASPLLVWVGCLGVFGLAGPGGDTLLLADWRALLLFACGAFSSAIAIGRTMVHLAGR